MDPRLSRGLVCSLAALLLTLAASVGVQGQDDEYITCYNYTWTGKNVSVDCEDHKTDIMNEEQPCLYTLVYTVPPESPPNVTDLENQCSTVQKCPSYTCKAKGKKCIKLSWYDITSGVCLRIEFLLSPPPRPVRHRRHPRRRRPRPDVAGTIKNGWVV